MEILQTLPDLPAGGQILIDKPTGMTSFGVVARIRRILTKHFGRKVKVGHTGTLDPFASGLMVLVYGQQTRQAMKLTKLDKVYEAEIILGKTSTTGDPEGEITVISSDIKPSQAEINQVLEQFTGKITQTPPIFSAIKIDGRRAYDLAREGKSVEIPSREVEILSIELLKYDFPQLKIRTHVSSGTYIRSLAEDIGEQLGTGAYCSALRRTRVGDFDIKDALSLQDFGIVD